MIMKETANMIQRIWSKVPHVHQLALRLIIVIVVQ